MHVIQRVLIEARKKKEIQIFDVVRVETFLKMSKHTQLKK